MTMVYNSPTYSFVVEAYNSEGQTVCRFRIDQNVRNVNRIHEVERAHNNIENTLHHYHQRTGLDYAAIATGPKEEIDKFIESNNLTLD